MLYFIFGGVINERLKNQGSDGRTAQTAESNHVNSQSNFHSVRRHEVTVENVVGISLVSIEKAEVNLKRCLKSALKCAIHCTDGHASPSETRLVSE